MTFIHNLKLQEKKKNDSMNAFLYCTTNYCGESEMLQQQLSQIGYLTEFYCLQIEGCSTTVNCFFIQQKAIYRTCRLTKT